MPLFDIVATDARIRFNHTNTSQKQSFPRGGYRFELRNDRIIIVESGTGQQVFIISDPGDVNSITDNRTGGAGVVAVPTTIDALFEALDAPSNPFFFRSLTALAPGIAHDPFILVTGEINSTSLDGTGKVRVATAFPDAIGFNSITPDKDNATFSKEVRFSQSDYVNVLSHIGSNASLQFDASDNAFYFTSDNGVEGEAVMYLGTSENYYGHSGFNLVAKSDISNFGGTSTEGGMYLEYGTGSANKSFVVGKNTTGTVGTLDFDLTAALILNSRNATFNQGVNNSVIIAGDTVTANKSNYAFTQNLEIQGGILNGANSLDMRSPVGSIQLRVGATPAAYNDSYIIMNNDNIEVSNGFEVANRTILGLYEGEHWFSYYTTAANTFDSFYCADNSAGAVNKRGNADSYPVFVGGHHSNGANSGVTNSVVTAGVGVIADKDDYLFTENLEVQGGNLNLTAGSSITTAQNGLVLESTINNTEFVNSSTGGTGNGAYFSITNDGNGGDFSDNWFWIDNRYIEIGHGDGAGIATFTIDGDTQTALISIGSGNKLVEANTTRLAFGAGSLPVRINTGSRFHYEATPALGNTLDIPHRGYVDTMLPLAGGTITGDVTITDSNLILSATTGTQIGTATTQKLSLWGATPIVQPTALTAAETTLTFVDENTPDFALSSLTTTTPAGFATLDEAQAFVEVVANLQTRVQELEDKLQALGAIA